MSRKTTDRDEFMMKEALRLAARGRGHTSPNPMVGAVVVQDGVIVGKGYHEYAGGPHGEVNALRQAGRRARGATLYVTLEPCNHFGRTPPCTDAILEADVKRVVVGMADPNPHVRGHGADRLREKGVTVDVGILEKECRQLNQSFIKHVTTGLPFVTLKAAATLDGRIATRTGNSRWISNERSRRFVHRLRGASDGILVGIDTAILDDPQLTCRLHKRTIRRQPVRIVVDTHLRLPVSSRLVGTARQVPLWVACGEGASTEKEAELVNAGAEVLRLPFEGGHVDINCLLAGLGKRHITSLLVEGGARILGYFLEKQLADEFYFFYAPKILADPEGVCMISGEAREHISQAIPVYHIKTRHFGGDVLLLGRLREHLY